MTTGFTTGRALRPTGKVLPEHARGHNRSLVLQTLYRGALLSRADIARETGGGLSLPIWIRFMQTALKGVPEMETPPPEGVVNVNPGDEVVCEIDGLGRLSNTIVGDDAERACTS